MITTGNTIPDDEIEKKEIEIEKKIHDIDQSLTDVEKVFTDGKVRSLITIVSYALLIFLTGVYGFGFYNTVYVREKFSHRLFKNFLILILIISWVLLMVSEIMGLKMLKEIDK
jgi:hypothetical protein